MQQTENALISIIVPVYNVEKCINRCLDSLVAQSYPNTEVILVDDGSTDRSGAVCDEYAREHDNFTVVHQANSGVGAARNVGVASAHGDYITFADPDDFTEPKLYEKLMDTLLANEADIAVCQWQYVFANGRRGKRLESIPTDFFGKQSAVHFAELLAMGTYERVTGCVLWNKLYKRKVFDGLVFHGRHHEDERIHNSILSAPYTVAVIPDHLYCYCQTQGSLTAASFNEDSPDYLNVLAERIKLFPKSKAIKTKARTEYIEHYVFCYFNADKSRLKLPNKQFYRRCLTALCFTGRIRFKRFVSFSIFCVSPRLYSRLRARRTAEADKG